jgi:hypothetical protein
LSNDLLDDCLDARGRYGFAINHGNVLSESWYSGNGEKCNQQLGWLESHY